MHAASTLSTDIRDHILNVFPAPRFLHVQVELDLAEIFGDVSPFLRLRAGQYEQGL